VNEFKATHEITLLIADGTARTFEVQLARGNAHTRAEWLRGTPSGWNVRDGQWSFDDRPAPPGCVTLAITPVAVAALDRLAWELVDRSHGVRYERRQLVFDRRAAGARLWLEAAEDHLRLTDGKRAFHVDVRATASWLRELVNDWVAAERG
jgi:hypothetical protein